MSITAAPRVPERTSAHQPAGFRPDVEGLRAIAILTVLWFHARLPFLDGGFAGVDIFFVISGFLITGQLVREIERSGRLSLPGFYARRAKRLFPAAATVLVSTGILTWLFLPRSQQATFGGDIAAAAAYVVNWRFASRSVDYLAEDVGASPVQHFWSLAVEEQFYIVWPLLIFVLAVLIRRGHIAVRSGLAVGLTLITVPSLIWSIHLTATQTERAYFVTTTRLWELGIGALVAVGSVRWARLTPRNATVLAWGGLALLTVGVLTQSTRTPWPGYAALVPTVGAALVIIGGFAAGSRGPVRVLGRAFPVWVGALSYSLYLWHWPLVVVADELSGANGAWAVAACVFAFLPAWATNRLIENPVRFHPRVAGSTRVALAMGLAFSLLGVAAGGAVARGGQRSWVQVTGDGAAVGAATATGPAGLEVDMHPAWMVPDPLKATADVPASDVDNCTSNMTDDNFLVCDYGDLRSRSIVAVVGDSKIAQWLPALDRLGMERGWRVRIYTKSACAWNSALLVLGETTNRNCKKWGARVLSQLTTRRPIAVLTSSRVRHAYDSSGLRPAALVDGYVDYWSRLSDVGVPVIAVADTPDPRKQVYECVLDDPDNFMRSCAFPFNEGSGTSALRAAVARVPTARLIDLNDQICPGRTQCVPVVGNVLIYRQGSHITATYAATLAPQLGKLLDKAIADLGAR